MLLPRVWRLTGVKSTMFSITRQSLRTDEWPGSQPLETRRHAVTESFSLSSFCSALCTASIQCGCRSGWSVGGEEEGVGGLPPPALSREVDVSRASLNRDGISVTIVCCVGERTSRMCVCVCVCTHACAPPVCVCVCVCVKFTRDASVFLKVMSCW